MNELAKKKILVTGGAGFIGSHIAERLVHEGYDVVVLDTLRTGSRANLAPIADRVTFIEGSILNREILKKSMDGVAYVFHEAAIPSVPESVEHPRETHEVNVAGTLAVFEAAKEAGVKRVVFASSCAVYGDSPIVPKVETMPVAPLSPYATEKVTDELYGALFSSLYGLETVGLRYFNVFGPRQDPHSEYSGVISKFITQAQKNEPITIYGDGEQTRDFVYVGDVVEANVHALERDGISGKVFNIARGESVTLNELFSHVKTLTGLEGEAHYSEARKGDIRQSSADISSARAFLAYHPQVSLEDGLRATIAYFQNAG